MSKEEKSISAQPDSPATTSSYRSIFKATSLFGGVQVYQIIIQIIKSKFVAILLGPAGVGINGLYTSATSLIKEISSLGLSSSAVRDVSEAYSRGDNERINKTVTVARKLFWLTGLIGMLLVIILSPLLSKTTFGSSSYIIPLIIVSVTLLLDQLSAGQKVLLQGTRRLKYLAKASAIGVTVGLLVCVPLYYFWGLKAIVPAIILHSITTLALSTYYSNKSQFSRIKISLKDTFKEGVGMLKMGAAMALSGVLVALVAYVLRSYISNTGGLEEVGLFSAANAIMSTYTALVFKAMGTDFYPRLAAVNNDNVQCKKIINQQGEIGLLIMAPILIACIVYAPLVIQVLYSNKFLATNGYIVWASCGMMFKIASWSISYIFIAKAESKLFIINELTSGFYTLGLNLLGYKYGGLTGLGISFTVSYVLYFIQVYVVSRRIYQFSFSSSFYKLFFTQLIAVFIGAIFYVFLDRLYVYVLGTVLLGISFSFSLIQLEKRIQVKESLIRKFKNN